MESTFPFLEMFFEYEPEGPLRAALGQAAVCHAEIDRENRSLKLNLQFQDYLSAEWIEKTEGALRDIYGLQSVRIFPKFPPEKLADGQTEDLNRILILAYSPAAEM